MQGSHFSVMTKFYDFSIFPGVIFLPFLNVPCTSFDSFISMWDSDLKSTEPQFSSFERNLPRPPIHWLKSKE